MNSPSFWLKTTLSSLQTLLDRERKIGVEILELLSELERRKAYCELGYDGLFSFCVEELKFTEAQAFQRIRAMRALQANLEIKEKLSSGALNVGTVSKVQVFLRREKQEGFKRPQEEVKALFQQIEHKTVKEVKVKLAELKGEKPKERLTLEMDEETLELWKEAKALSSNQSEGNEANAFKIILKDWISLKKKRRNQVGLIQVAADHPKSKRISISQFQSG